MNFFKPYFTGLGIDVSDHHVRLAQVSVFGFVRLLEEFILPKGLVVDEHVEQPDELRATLMEKLAKLSLSHQTYRTTVLVPESRVFSNSTLLPKTAKGQERVARARDAAQREIPVPFSQAVVCTSFGAREGTQIRATVYAVEKRVFDPLIKVFDCKALRLVAVEANTKALLRLVLAFGKDAMRACTNASLIAIVDVGHAWTTLALYTPAGSSLFSRTIPHVPQKKVDLKKIKLPENTVDTIVGVIQETVLFFQEQKMSIGCVVLGGVEAADERFQTALRKADVKTNVYLISDVVKLNGVSKSQLHAFGAAIGAAWRSVHPQKHAYQHNFLET